MKYTESEALGFRRADFPLHFRDHKLQLLCNDTVIRDDGEGRRLELHLILSCQHCSEEHSIRGRLPPEYDDYEYRAALAKFVLLGAFTVKENP